jgi:hypothetical protein
MSSSIPTFMDLFYIYIYIHTSPKKSDKHAELLLLFDIWRDVSVLEKSELNNTRVAFELMVY